MQHHIEIPPEPIIEDKHDKSKFQRAIGDDKGHSDFPIRKTSINDVIEILEMVNGFAASNLMLPRGPQYIYENIRDFVVVVNEKVDATGRGKNARGMIVACGSLHVIWEDMAEIRSVAIHPDFQKRGLGRRIVEYMKEDARHLGIKRLFTFTLAEEFFKTLGFESKKKEELPAKVWVECTRCPKYFKCDEVGMILEI